MGFLVVAAVLAVLVVGLDKFNIGPTAATNANATSTTTASQQPQIFSFDDTTVTCTATDSLSEPGSGSFTVTVQDTSVPVVTVPSPITKEAAGPDGAVVTFLASASDTNDGALTPGCSPASGDTFPIGTTSVTCSADTIVSPRTRGTGFPGLGDDT